MNYRYWLSDGFKSTIYSPDVCFFLAFSCTAVACKKYPSTALSIKKKSNKPNYNQFDRSYHSVIDLCTLFFKCLTLRINIKKWRPCLKFPTAFPRQPFMPTFSILWIFSIYLTIHGSICFCNYRNVGLDRTWSFPCFFIIVSAELTQSSL